MHIIFTYNFLKGSKGYKSGFQGQMKDDEIYGPGNAYSAQYWEYDARLGRRWNLDPIPYPFQSSYCVFNNNPIYFVDPEGLEGQKPNKSNKINFGLFTIEKRQHLKGFSFEWNTNFHTAFMASVGGLRKALSGAERKLSLVPMGGYRKNEVNLTFNSFIEVEVEEQIGDFKYQTIKQIETKEPSNHTFTPISIAKYNYKQNNESFLIKDINSLYIQYNFYANPDHIKIYRKSKRLYKWDDKGLGDWKRNDPDITGEFYYAPMLKNPNEYSVNILVGPDGSGWMFTANFSVNAWMKYNNSDNKRPWWHQYFYGIKQD